MVQGRCLCGAIEYEVELIPGKVFNCHCSRCRQSHGAAFATQAFADGTTLRFIKGQDQLREYEHNGAVRAFCGQCGSRLMNYALDKTRYLSVALANVQGDIPEGPVAHAFVGSKASWHEPSDDIPAYEGMPNSPLD